jgi:hypothetical protein
LGGVGGDPGSPTHRRGVAAAAGAAAGDAAWDAARAAAWAAAKQKLAPTALQARIIGLEALGNHLAETASTYLFENESSAEETALDRAIVAWRGATQPALRKIPQVHPKEADDVQG